MRIRTIMLPMLALGLLGCSSSGPDSHAHKHGEKEHSHERGKMLLADAGKYHAALTAHLSSKEGNELDIFFETAADEPKPVPLPLDVFKAQATTGDGKVYELTFDPSEPDERKDDPVGKCSHFVAKAWWMKADEKIKVVATVPIEGKDVSIEWKDFHPKKYAHHED